MPSNAPLILDYAGVSPRFASPLVHAGAGSSVLGRAVVGRSAWLGPLAVLRADGHDVTVGDDIHVGARSTLHINHGILPCIVGDRVAIGSDACVHACTVGNDVIIGDGVVILDGAGVEDNVVFEAASCVYPNKRIASGFLYAGSPAKPVRPLAPGEVAERRAGIMRAREKTDAAGPLPMRLAAGSEVDPSVFIASTASVCGALVAAASSSIWFSNVFDAGNATITIGPRTNIQDNTVIRCSTGEGVILGRDCSVGHNVTIHDCVVGEESLLGIGSFVAPGTVVGDRVLLAASARTTPGQVLEGGWLYAGDPARKLAPLDAGKVSMISEIVAQYCEYARDFKALDVGMARAG